MQIFLPEYFNENTVQGFCNNLLINGKPTSSTFIFDFSNLKFIEPSGITALSNIIEFLHKYNAKVTFNLDNSLANYIDNPIWYLDDANFFYIYEGAKIFNNSKQRATTLSLQKVEIENRQDWLTNVLVPWIRMRLADSGNLRLESFKLCIMEIFNNINDHSSEKIACLYAQHYPNIRQIKICISDFGVGIPYNVAKVITLPRDSCAILEAVKQGFSSKSISQNIGAGLDVLMKNVVINNHGKLTILSSKGKVDFYRDNASIGSYNHKAEDSSLSGYPGTLINIVINTDNFKGDEEEEDFTW